MNNEKIGKLIFALEMFLQAKVRVVFRDDMALAKLNGEIPFTWEQLLLSDLPTRQVIGQLWKPLEQYANAFVEILANSTLNLAIVLSPEKTFPISLFYVAKLAWRDQIFFEGWLGGLPTSDRDLAKCETRLNFSLPVSYKLFGNVHNGFLKNGNQGNGLLPVESLSFLHRKDLPEDLSLLHDSFSDDELLSFYRDGAGNQQSYHLSMPHGSGDYMTVDWDHETREISNPQAFWLFLERFIEEEMKYASI